MQWDLGSLAKYPAAVATRLSRANLLTKARAVSKDPGDQRLTRPAYAIRLAKEPQQMSFLAARPAVEPWQVSKEDPP